MKEIVPGVQATWFFCHSFTY